MSSVRLTNGVVLHLPGAPHIKDSTGAILPPDDAGLAAVVPLIPLDDLLLFTGRLVAGARKRRRQPRWADMNAARLKMARECIDRALIRWPEIQTVKGDVGE